MRGDELETLDRFGDAFELLEALQVACLAVGVMFDDEHCGSAREQHEPRVNVLRQLWAASVRAGGEAIVLLRAGYPEGALGRWRLVREAEVLSLFLMEQPVEVSLNLLHHAAFKAVSMKGDVQRWLRWAGGEPLTDQEMREMGRKVGDILAEHPEWRGDYGWAHEPLLRSHADYRRSHEQYPRQRGPSFADLEAAVGQRPSKLWWSWARRPLKNPGLVRPSRDDSGHALDDLRTGWFFDAAELIGPAPEGSFFALLAEHGERVVRDEDFAECYSEGVGRPSIPPSRLAKVLLL